MSPAARRIFASVAGIAAIAAIVGIWIVRGPGPMAFAGGPNVALSDYRAADPTGVPTSLAKADAVERGAYLARAADCMVCHTSQGGREYAGGLPFRLPFGTPSTKRETLSSSPRAPSLTSERITPATYVFVTLPMRWSALASTLDGPLVKKRIPHMLFTARTASVPAP